MRNWTSVALLLSISLNAAMLAGYVYGAVSPKLVEGKAKIKPGLRDPNLTAEQIQAIKKIQETRNNWLEEWGEQYRNQLLAIADLLDTRNPDWNEVETQQVRFLKMRQDFEVVLFHSWSDINSVLTPQQGKAYMEALRKIIRSIDYSKTGRTY